MTDRSRRLRSSWVDVRSACRSHGLRLLGAFKRAGSIRRERSRRLMNWRGWPPVLKKYGGFYATHMRSEADHLIEAVREALEIGRRAGVPVQISHLKTMDQRNWHKLPDALALIEKARRSGMDVTSDRYPYCASSTGLDAHPAAVGLCGRQRC